MKNRKFLETLSNYNLASVMVNLVMECIDKYHEYGQDPYITDRIIREKISEWLDKEIPEGE